MTRMSAPLESRSLVSPNVVLAAGVVFSLLALPAVIQDPYIWGILVMANIYAALAAGLDVLMGYAGLPVIGYGLFVGVGAYGAAFLNLYLGLPPVVTIPAGGLIGALFGLLLGVPCLRLRGLYLALASLAAAAICEKMVIVSYDLTDGREGMSGLDPISELTLVNYYVSLALLLVFAGLLMALVRSKLGLILNSIRDDQDAAEAVGIDTNRYKLIAFLMASFIGGFWGAFMGHYMMHVGPEMFGLRIALMIIMITIVGGLGTVTGSLGGAYLLIVLNELLRGIGQTRLLIFTAVTVVIMLALPRGAISTTLDFLVRGLTRLGAILSPKRGG